MLDGVEGRKFGESLLVEVGESAVDDMIVGMKS